MTDIQIMHFLLESLSSSGGSMRMSLCASMAITADFTFESLAILLLEQAGQMPRELGSEVNPVAFAHPESGTGGRR